jgi:hypothetical protein
MPGIIRFPEWERQRAGGDCNRGLIHRADGCADQCEMGIAGVVPQRIVAGIDAGVPEIQTDDAGACVGSRETSRSA